jgi:hypothetical protein
MLGTNGHRPEIGFVFSNSFTQYTARGTPNEKIGFIFVGPAGRFIIITTYKIKHCADLSAVKLALFFQIQYASLTT